MRALVTGGAGFIGSHLVRRLVDEGWDVDVVDNLSTGTFAQLREKGVSFTLWDCSGVLSSEKLFRKPDHWIDASIAGTDVTFMKGDLTHYAVQNQAETFGYDVIFHQAAVPRVAYSVENPIETMWANLNASCSLLKLAAELNIPVVFASSSSVYGGAEILPTTEDQAGKEMPKSPYAMQKWHMEHYAELYGSLYGLRSIGLRYFNVFGPGQRAGDAYATAVAAWCNAVKYSEAGLTCRSDGDGEQTRDLCYVDNVVDANMLAAKRLLSSASDYDARQARCYNVACGYQTSNNEILDALMTRFGDKVKIVNAPERLGDVKHTRADLTLINEDLGYVPSVHFWDGFEKTLEWWDIK